MNIWGEREMEMHSGCGLGDFEKACLYKKISKEVHFMNVRGMFDREAAECVL